jgi:hypothetical protein
MRDRWDKAVSSYFTRKAVPKSPSVNTKFYLPVWKNLTPWINTQLHHNDICGCHDKNEGYTIRWDAQEGKSLSEYSEFWRDMYDLEILYPDDNNI